MIQILFFCEFASSIWSFLRYWKFFVDPISKNIFLPIRVSKSPQNSKIFQYAPPNLKPITMPGAKNFKNNCTKNIIPSLQFPS